MQQVGRGIFYEDAYLGVTLGGLVFSHGTILVDAPLRPEDARSWRSALLNQRGGGNRLLVNLDAHPDRTLGARTIECTIVAHQKTAQIFRNRPTIFKGQSIETGSAWEVYTDAIGMRWAVPDITFTNKLSLHWGGPEVVLEHHPGPGPGAIWVVIPSEKVVFVGDAVVTHQPPFLANADIAAWLESLDELLESYKEHAIVTGRGGLADREAIRDLRAFLQETQEGIDRLSKRNAPVDATDELIPPLLSRLSFPRELKEIYTRRLSYGLHQYYNRRFRLSGPIEPTMIEEEE